LFGGASLTCKVEKDTSAASLESFVTTALNLLHEIRSFGQEKNSTAQSYWCNGEPLSTVTVCINCCHPKLAERSSILRQCGFFPPLTMIHKIPPSLSTVIVEEIQGVYVRSRSVLERKKDVVFKVFWPKIVTNTQCVLTRQDKNFIRCGSTI